MHDLQATDSKLHPIRPVFNIFTFNESLEFSQVFVLHQNCVCPCEGVATPVTFNASDVNNFIKIAAVLVAVQARRPALPHKWNIIKISGQVQCWLHPGYNILPEERWSLLRRRRWRRRRLLPLRVPPLARGVWGRGVHLLVARPAWRRLSGLWTLLLRRLRQHLSSGWGHQLQGTQNFEICPQPTNALSLPYAVAISSVTVPCHLQLGHPWYWQSFASNKMSN